MTEPLGDSVARAVGRLLSDRQESVAVGESCTGGLVTARLTAVPGASAYVLGGVVAYADEVKVEFLAVERGLLRRHGAVSGPAAEAIAAGAAARLGAHWGVGVTGIAGPGGGSEEKPVGTVWVAVSHNGRSWSERHHFPGDRDSVRRASVDVALELLLRRLQADPY